MKLSIKVWSALATVALLTACTASSGRDHTPATQDWGMWSFSPPPKWTPGRPPGIAHFLPDFPGVRDWYDPQSALNSVSLQLVRNVTSTPHPNLFEVAEGTIALCHGQRALLVHTNPPFGPVVSDSVEAQAHGNRAIATFDYRRSQSPDPRGEAAIRSLCFVGWKRSG